MKSREKKDATGITIIKLEKKQLEFDGRVFEVSCNMAVLAALEEARGSLDAVINLPTFQQAPELLAAMLNDYAEDQGWEIRYTPKQVAQRINLQALNELDVLGMFIRAVSGAEAAPAEDDPDGTSEGITPTE